MPLATSASWQVKSPTSSSSLPNPNGGLTRYLLQPCASGPSPAPVEHMRQPCCFSPFAGPPLAIQTYTMKDSMFAPEMVLATAVFEGLAYPYHKQGGGGGDGGGGGGGG